LAGNKRPGYLWATLALAGAAEHLRINPPAKKSTAQNAPGSTIAASHDLRGPHSFDRSSSLIIGTAATLTCEQGVLADPAINHVNRTVVDPADAIGIVLGAWADGVLTGTVRLNLLRDGPASPYTEVLRSTTLHEDERRLPSVTSRLMVGTRWRGSALGIRLGQAAVRHYVASGLAWDHIVVRPEMEPFYTRLGSMTLASTSTDGSTRRQERQRVAVGRLAHAGERTQAVGDVLQERHSP
jgi:hypothetical protein